MAWSFRCLGKGEYPVTRHGGTEFLPSEPKRVALAQTPTRLRGALVYVKGDWSEYATTLGFLGWGDGLRPCYQCNAVGDGLYAFQGLSLHSAPWRCNELGDYDAACQSG